MKVLVTGGAGFIGSHLVDALLKRGEEVVVVDEFNDFYDPALKRENIAQHASNPAFSLFELDIRDAARLKEVVAETSPEVVCHLAARAGVRPSIEDPLLYEEVNSIGTLNLLQGVRDAGISLKNFVFASSSSVYGTLSKLPFSEDDPITCPVSPYAVTKRSSELMLYAFSRLFKMPVTCLRFFTAYGERGRPEMAVANFTRCINEGRELPLYGDGSARRDFTYIGDIISGVVQSVYRPFPFEIINLGESRTVEVSELISIIEDKLGKEARIKRFPAAPGDVPATFADISKARRLLGYDPQVCIEDGVEKYVKWFLQIKS